MPCAILTGLVFESIDFEIRNARPNPAASLEEGRGWAGEWCDDLHQSSTSQCNDTKRILIGL